MINKEVASKARSFDKMKSKAENCSLTQGDKLCNEKKKWSLRVQLIQRQQEEEAAEPVGGRELHKRFPCLENLDFAEEEWRKNNFTSRCTS